MKSIMTSTLCLAALLFVLGSARPAHAEPTTYLPGCVYTINFKNDHPKPLTLTRLATRVAGVEKKQWAGATKVEGGKTYTMTIKTTFGCKVGKKFFLWYKYSGSNHSASRSVPKGKTEITWKL